MDLQRIPVARELFEQWRKARGMRPELERTRAFTRNWSDLLEDAGLLSAVEQNDAGRDAMGLQQAGLLEVKSVRYKPHLIERVSIPLDAEIKWMENFGFARPDDHEWRLIQNYAWEPELTFAAGARLNLSFEELQQLNNFFAGGGRNLPRVPIKERSLTVFGDEKRLDLLYASSALFAEGRLTLEHLRCFVVAEPLGWRRGIQPGGAIIILENAATWHTYCQWDAIQPQFSAIVYGGGKRILHSIESLQFTFEELGGSRPLCYFGDLDAAGLRIGRIASERAVQLGYGVIQPHLWSYRQLLDLASTREITQVTEGQNFNKADVEWLGEWKAMAENLLSLNKRIPQEWLSLDLLRRSKS